MKREKSENTHRVPHSAFSAQIRMFSTRYVREERRALRTCILHASRTLHFTQAHAHALAQRDEITRDINIMFFPATRLAGERTYRAAKERREARLVSNIPAVRGLRLSRTARMASKKVLAIHESVCCYVRRLS